MPKIEVQKVAEILQHNQLPPEQLRRIVEEINEAVRRPEGEEKPEAVKKQYAILLSDVDHRMVGDYVGWILQIPEDESPATTQDRIFRGAYDFNATKRGRRLPVKTVGEALENVPAKHFKEAELWVKTKTPVLVLCTDNKIPAEPKEGEQ
jgi:hypothetical protein